MIFRPTELAGAFIVDPERRVDQRGFFARSWCQREFDEHGLSTQWVQGNISQNSVRGTVRGMHYQLAPHEESKLISCPRGSVFDVIVDIRSASQTYGRWWGVELSAENARSLYIPGGFAHGFQTLTDDTMVSYQMSAYFQPGAACGIRYDDPALRISWPLLDVTISDRDRGYADWLP